MIAWLGGLAAAGAVLTPPLAGSLRAQEASRPGPTCIEAAGMRLLYRLEGDRLVGTLSGPTRGWVLVGFNHPGRGLEGARLFFFALDADGRVLAEEHEARPPRHAPRRTLGEADRIEVRRASERGGTTQVSFRLPARPRTGVGVRLTSGREVELILAYSVSDDFDHHSRRRVHQRLTL